MLVNTKFDFSYIHNSALRNRPGIYAFYCSESNKYYIGQAKCLYTRIKSHRAGLRKNRHVNSHLQAAYNKYSESSFSISIIEIDVFCKQDRNKLEKMYIDLYDSRCDKKGYNLCYFDEDGSPTYTPISKKVRRESIEARSRFTKNDIKVIRELALDGYSNHFIHKKYRIDPSNVCKIVKNIYWIDVDYTPPVREFMSLNKLERELLDRAYLSGASANEVSKQFNIPHRKINKYFRGKYNCTQSHFRNTILNTETGVFYRSFEEAADSTGAISANALRQIIYSGNNTTPFLVLDHKIQAKSQVVVLNTSTGVYYEDYGSAADTIGISRKTLSNWIKNPRLNKSNFILV